MDAAAARSRSISAFNCKRSCEATQQLCSPNPTPFAREPEAAVVSLTRDLPLYGRCISARPDGRAFLLSIDDAIHREIFVADLPN